MRAQRARRTGAGSSTRAALLASEHSHARVALFANARLRTWITLLALLPAVLLCGAATPLEAAPAWRERYLAVLTQCRGGDPAVCRDSLLALRGLLPGHPRVVSALARACARAGDGAGVVHALGLYADMGLAADPAADSTFVAWWQDSAFVRVSAQLAASARPLARATALHRFADRNLLSEDVGYDAARRRWLVSSIARRAVIAVDRAGRETRLVLRGGDPLWGVYALGVDSARRRLWLGTAATPESGDTASAVRGRSALRCYDLDRGVLLRSLEVSRSGGAHVLGGMTVAANGDVYVTDSVAGGVYRARWGEDSLGVIVPPGSFVSPQSPVLFVQERVLVVADYSRGIAAVELEHGAVSWLALPRALATAGIDGLYLWRGHLLAVQNGVEPHRIVAFELDLRARSITGSRVLEQASPDLGEPNHGAVLGDAFVFIGNSGWERVGEDGRMDDGKAALPPLLMRLELPLALTAPAKR